MIGRAGYGRAAALAAVRVRGISDQQHFAHEAQDKLRRVTQTCVFAGEVGRKLGE
jgi:hypothetical protein